MIFWASPSQACHNFPAPEVRVDSGHWRAGAHTPYEPGLTPQTSNSRTAAKLKSQEICHGHSADDCQALQNVFSLMIVMDILLMIVMDILLTSVFPKLSCRAHMSSLGHSADS